MNTLRVVEHSTMPTEKKKRIPNCFILYRKEMMKNRPHNITMVEYSKIVGEKWNKLPQKEKNVWKKRYEIYRDCVLQSSPEEISYSYDSYDEPILIMNEVLPKSSSKSSSKSPKSPPEEVYSYDGAKVLIMNEVENYINRCGVNITPECLLKVYYEIYLYNNNPGSFDNFIMSFLF